MSLQFWSYIACCWAICHSIPVLVVQGRVSSAATNLIVEEGVPDVFCDSGCSLNIVWTIFVALDVDAGAERVSLIPNQREGTRREN